MASKAGGKKAMAGGKEAKARKSVSTEEIEQVTPLIPRTGKKLPLMESSRKIGKKKQKVRETFNCYIYRVLKLVHPDVGISKKAIEIMDCFLNDFFDKLVGEAYKLRIRGKQSTITAREIQTSAKLVLPKELAKHAISEGLKAVTKFSTE